MPGWGQRPSATTITSPNIGVAGRVGAGDSHLLWSGPHADQWDPGLAAASMPWVCQMVSDRSHSPASLLRYCSRPHRSSEALQGVGSLRGAKLPPSPALASVPHGPAASSQVPTLMAVWSSLGGRSWRRPAALRRAGQRRQGRGRPTGWHGWQTWPTVPGCCSFYDIWPVASKNLTSLRPPGR